MDQAEPEDKKISENVRKRDHDADMGGADALPLVSYIKFISGARLTFTVITNRLHEMLMSDLDLMESLKLDRKALEKPPDWNKSQQLMLFGEFLQCKILRGQQ